VNDLLSEIVAIRELLKQPSLHDQKPPPVIASPDAFKSVRLKDKVDALKRIIEIRRELEELANG
jgi:hypothetical protein